MELLGFSLLVSREQPSSSPLRATEEEGILSLCANQEAHEAKGDARGDFAALLTFLFPHSSPEEGEKSREQRGSTAFGQANHVEALFPQSPEETFPSSPESVPTHGVSSALPSSLIILPDHSDTEAILPVNLQEEDLTQPDPLPVDFFVQLASPSVNQDEPARTDGDCTASRATDVSDGMAIPPEQMLRVRQHRAAADTHLLQELTLHEADVLPPRQQMEQVQAVLPTMPFTQENQPLPIPEPEQEDVPQQLRDHSSLAVDLPPSLLAMVMRHEVASVSASSRGGPRASVSSPSFSSPTVQNSYAGFSTGVAHRTVGRPLVLNGSPDVQPNLVASDGTSAVTISPDLSPIAAAAPESAPPVPPLSLNDTIPATTPREMFLPEGTPAVTVGRIDRSLEKREESPLVSPYPPRVRQLSTVDALDSAQVPVLGQLDAAATDAQPRFSPTIQTQTERTHSVGQPGARSYPTENTQVEISQDAPPGPTLLLDGSAEAKLRLLSPDTHPLETEVLQHTPIHGTSALPAPGGEALYVSSTSLTLPRSSPALTKPSPSTGTAVIEQVAGQIAAHIGQSSKKAVLELEPQELGHVQIDLELQGEQVQVRIVTERADVSTLIQTHLLELKTALQHHNLELGTVSVDVNTRDGDRETFARDTGQQFGTNNGGSGGNPRAQPHETDYTERRHPNTAAPLQPQGVSVWA